MHANQLLTLGILQKRGVIIRASVIFAQTNELDTACLGDQELYPPQMLYLVQDQIKSFNQEFDWLLTKHKPPILHQSNDPIPCLQVFIIIEVQLASYTPDYKQKVLVHSDFHLEVQLVEIFVTLSRPFQAKSEFNFPLVYLMKS